MPDMGLSLHPTASSSLSEEINLAGAMRSPCFLGLGNHLCSLLSGGGRGVGLASSLFEDSNCTVNLLSCFPTRLCTMLITQ